MQEIPVKAQPRSPLERLVAWLGRLLISLFVPAITFLVLWAGFRFLRDANAPKGVVALVAIIWGVGGVALLYFVANWFVERLGERWRALIQPFVFVGPAVAILVWYLALPTVRTFWLSLFDRNGKAFVGLSNYLAVFTNRDMFTAFRNNLMWIVIGAMFCVALGLVIATLADRSRFETVAKSLIFLPMAISMVGAGVIWNMIYDISPNVGLLNAVVTGLGGKAVAWTAAANIQPWNNLFLIVIVIWLQTGYAMVLFSAAIKGIPAEIQEAARVDGATELQVFFQIMIPYIMGTIIAVTTTIVIFTLKIFDVVQVMTGGQFSTQVIATEFYRQSFQAQNSGYGSAIAIVLLIAVVPVMFYNLRQFSQREVF